MLSWEGDKRVKKNSYSEPIAPSAAGNHFLSGILQDLRYTFRLLRKSPGFTAVAVLMLAFGIGATTAIFSIVDGILLRPLPFPNPNRLVTLGDQLSNTDWGHHDPGPVTGPESVIYPRDARSFESLGGYGFRLFELSGIGEPARIQAARMNSSVFAALGVGPLIGRVFTTQEDQHGAQVAVLSYLTWKSRFNSDPHILGTKILLNREPYIVIGVMPRNFEFPTSAGRLYRSELWVPLSLTPQELASYGRWILGMVGRLKPGITPTSAESDVQRVARQYMDAFLHDDGNLRIRPVVYPLQQITVVNTRPMLNVLFLAVSVVLLIACFNFGGLLLVRAIRRQHEASVRLAIGAPALTLLRQTMLESLVLSLIGGLLGTGLAAFGLAIGKSHLPETLPLTNEIALNERAVGFALLLAILTGVLCGLAPGFVALRTNLIRSLKQAGRSGSIDGNHVRLRSTLVVVEIGITLVLLVASGLFLRSFIKMITVDLGFRPDHVTTTRYALPDKEYSTQAQVDTFNNKLLLELRQLPGVDSVGLTGTLPASAGDNISDFTVEGYVDPHGADLVAASPSQVIGDYFKAIGTSLIRGRFFAETDNANNQLVVIVNREFAEHYWSRQNPIGKQMHLGTSNSGAPWMTVVGEVADTKLNSPDADAAEQFYLPVAQFQKDSGAPPSTAFGKRNYIVIRSVLPPEQMANLLRATVRSIDPQLPLSGIQTMEEVVTQSEAPRRFITVVVSSFTLAAVLLAVLGVYSVVAFSVVSRVQEIAIRMALGAQRSHILQLIFISGFKLAAVGCVLGFAGSTAASSVLRSFLFHVSPFDPVVMIIAAIAVFALALLASVLPARRAAAVDPIGALRGE